MSDLDDDILEEDILERFKELPGMTLEQRIEQKIDFVWGNLATSTNHRPRSKEAIAAMVWKREWQVLYRDEEARIWAQFAAAALSGCNVEFAAEQATRLLNLYKSYNSR